jgi:hypothetical protein
MHQSISFIKSAKFYVKRILRDFIAKGDTDEIEPFQFTLYYCNYS